MPKDTSKGKGKAASKQTTSSSEQTAAGKKKSRPAPSNGAPAQLNQSTRKGKKAWRKNVDIGEVERGLEEIRVEERVVGTSLANLKDSDLFEVDVKGDDNIRHIAPKFSSSQLTSAKILAQRSEVPAVFSRPSTSTKKRKSQLTREEKERLLRIAKKPRKGPFNSVLADSEMQAGDGIVELSAAVKESGTYDAWEDEEDVEVKDGLENVQKRKPKVPATLHQGPRNVIAIPAVTTPHQGTSYNPDAAAHQELLQQAYEKEVKHLQDMEKMAETKRKMEGALRVDEDVKDRNGKVFKVGGVTIGPDGLPAGMTLDSMDVDEAEEEEEEVLPKKKMPKMKTTSEKNRKARILAEQQALKARLQKKKLLASVETARSIRKMNAAELRAQEERLNAARQAQEEKLKTHGLAGQKLGKHKVPESNVEVQIGEDLSESLRQLKPEGNLFRDRFQSLQQRALIEPRNLVLPKKRKLRIVEYEKHAWKRFV